MRVAVTGNPACLALFKRCSEVLTFSKENGLDDCLSQVMLVLPWQARGVRVRLCKNAGPWGLIAQVKQDETLAYFDARKVMSYLIKIGGITRIEYTPNKTA